MEESKVSQRLPRPRIDTGNVRKKRSPYQLQLLEYEKREDVRPRIKLPSLKSASKSATVSKYMNNKEYLALAM